MTPLTASEWLKQNYPNATGWHEDYAKEYAEYYHEMKVKESMVITFELDRKGIEAILNQQKESNG